MSDAEFARFQTLVRDHSGINLRPEKRHLLVARLAPHLRDLSIATFSAYYQYLAADASGEELRTLINRITTNKTSFFREPHHFEFLASHLIPDIQRGGSKPLRIWSAGCSSGEEPYSIAIALREVLGPAQAREARILASDIDTEMLGQAQAGIYPLESLEAVSAQRLRRHFLRGFGACEGLAQVRPELKRMVEFRRINFTQPDWGVDSRFHAIFCRNVIIYFDRSLQNAIVTRLAGYLNPGGCFFAGHSENLHWLRDLLVTVEPTVYRINHKGNPQ